MDTITDAVAAADAPVQQRRRRRPLLLDRNFALLLSGANVSLLGDLLFDTTLLLWIAIDLGAGQSWAPLAVSGVLVASTTPILLVGPLAGVFVDRWDKRRTLLWTIALRGALVLALLPATGLVPLPFLDDGRLPLDARLGLIYAVVFLLNTCGRFAAPASLALLADIVDEERRPRASGLSGVASSMATLLALPLAAPLLLAFGPAWALLINAASFLFAFGTVLALRSPAPTGGAASGGRRGVLREFGSGLRFFASNRVLRALLLSIVLVMLGGGAINALDVFFVTRNLHADVAYFGVLEAAQAAGAIVGAVLAAIFAQRIGVARVLWFSLIAVGMLILAYARMTAIAPALALIAAAGIATAALNVCVGPLLLHVTPREYVGRVASLLNPAVTVASLLSVAAAGYLASTVLDGFSATLYGVTFGPLDTIFSGAGLLAIVGGLYAMVGLRGVRLARQA